jgi:ATP-dependent helicase/nuclease subunit A
LEAPIIVLLDANHSEPARDDLGILCDWPQDADAPTHFSAFGRKAERGAARDQLFEAEEIFKAQEDWNLLYVALTRAKNILIVSGVTGSRGALADGTIEGSWYHRMQAVSPIELDQNLSTNQGEDAPEQFFDLPIFSPSPIPAPSRPAQSHSNAIDEGIALHGLLERLSQFHQWPINVPDVGSVARWLPCTYELAETICASASRILAQPELERFFNPEYYRAAHNEMDVIVDNELLRFDRIVLFDDEAWILDYKRDLLAGERATYEAQLARYRAAAKAVFPHKQIKSALVTADGNLWVVE